MFLLVGQKLGYWAALAGVSTLITLIPVQASRRWDQSELRIATGAAGILLSAQRRAAALPPRRAVSSPLPLCTAQTRLTVPQPRCTASCPQGVLVRYIGRLRAATAAQTDERVRLTGEVVSGMLATKMLGGWVGGCRERGARVVQGGRCGRRFQAWVGSRECWCS